MEKGWVETYFKDFPACYSISAKMEDKPVHSMHNLSFNNYPNTQFKKNTQALSNDFNVWIFS